MTFVRESNELSTDEKRRFFKSANTNFGTSALCLSGGAAFGYCTYRSGHFPCGRLITFPQIILVWPKHYSMLTFFRVLSRELLLELQLPR
jgi:poly(A) polymerase Pap1